MTKRRYTPPCLDSYGIEFAGCLLNPQSPPSDYETSKSDDDDPATEPALSRQHGTFTLWEETSEEY